MRKKKPNPLACSRECLLVLPYLRYKSAWPPFVNKALLGHSYILWFVLSELGSCKTDPVVCKAQTIYNFVLYGNSCWLLLYIENDNYIWLLIIIYTAWRLPFSTLLSLFKCVRYFLTLFSSSHWRTASKFKEKQRKWRHQEWAHKEEEKTLERLSTQLFLVCSDHQQKGDSLLRTFYYEVLF